MIEIEIQGLNVVIRELDRAKAKLRDFSEPLTEIGLYMERETKLNFAKQSAPDGSAWAPLKPSTLRTKRTRSILRETSTLINGIGASRASRTEVKVQSRGARYGIFQQTGTGKMAARPFLGVADRHLPKIRQILEEYIDING